MTHPESHQEGMKHHGKALGVDVLLVVLSQQLSLSVGLESQRALSSQDFLQTQSLQTISLAFALYSLLAVVQAGYNTVRFVQHIRQDLMQD